MFSNEIYFSERIIPFVYFILLNLKKHIKIRYVEHQFMKGNLSLYYFDFSVVNSSFKPISFLFWL